MPLRFTLRQLEYFTAVGESGSIAGASAKLNISPPSISSAISQLEAELGLSLFVRKHARGLTLTDAGARLLEQSVAILRSANDLNDLAGTISGRVQGLLKLGCLVTFAQIIAPGIRKTFEGSYPDVSFRQKELTQVEIFSQLRQAELDIALTYDLEIPSDLEFVPLLELPPFVIIDPGHDLAGRESVSVDDLRNLPMVLLDLPLSSEYFLSFFKQSNSKPLIAERTRDMAVMRSLVANGFGYSIANIRPINDRSPDGNELVFIPLTGDVRPMNMGLLMAKGGQRNTTIRAFIDHCKYLISSRLLPALTS